MLFDLYKTILQVDVDDFAGIDQIAAVHLDKGAGGQHICQFQQAQTHQVLFFLGTNLTITPICLYKKDTIDSNFFQLVPDFDEEVIFED